MKDKLPLFIGVFVSFFIIWLINDSVIVSDCLARGGEFQYNKGHCLLANGDIHISDSVYALMILYCAIGFLGSFFIAKLMRKLMP